MPLKFSEMRRTPPGFSVGGLTYYDAAIDVTYGDDYRTNKVSILEIEAAANFLSGLLKSHISRHKVWSFAVALRGALIEHYTDHWFPDKPAKGSGYRCIRINHNMDPVILTAARLINLHSQILLELLPKELTLWVDPYNVSYRIGENGSICVLYQASPSPPVAPVRPHFICKRKVQSNARAPSQCLISVSS